MLKSHERFFTENGKHLILIAAEDPQERAFLEEILREEYVLMFATNAKEAESLIRESGDVLSLALLHLREPHRAALDLLSLIQKEPELRQIPVMVADEDRDIEIEALREGAMAVIVLPYPMKEVVQARVRRTIELSEDRAIISSTERDPLTGLYNREYFYRYAEQYDHHHKSKAMDAIVIDVNNFRIINERFGSAYGDVILRKIGERVRDMVKDSGGIVCRREADTFQVYCPHGKSYQAILDNASIGLSGDGASSDQIRLRMGVYENVDKSLAIERRFDRANMAANNVRSNFTKPISIYDSSLHEKEMEDARLIEEFHQALNTHQFKVYFQPKFDVRGETPILTSAEALARWIHPKQGLIPPGRFIPLFEENGLIQLLDHYIWEEVARQMREWKNQLGFTVPVSVNVSRINMYDPNMVSFLLETLNKYNLPRADIFLEITESAYTEDAEQIIRKVELLRDLGFRIEMDDFGTGYSSLNMISQLPIDVLKLDMEFIRTAFQEGGQNTRMMEIMLDIAEYLDVPVVAEGVETEEQMLALKKMGCEVIQGYYFSKPVTAGEFESMLVRRRKQGAVVPVSAVHRHTDLQRLAEHNQDAYLQMIAQALMRGYSRLFDVDPVTERYTEYQPASDGSGLRIEKEGSSFFDFKKRKLVHYLHPEDQKMFLETFAKDNLGQILSKKPCFTGVFRLMLGDEPTFLYVKAAAVGAPECRRFIIGTSSLDVRFRTDQYIREAVWTIGRDSLTSTKNMSAYLDEERIMNEAIANQEADDFALAVVDMSGYRKLRETMGQKAADLAVQKLSAIVCEVFDHSPVFRIREDEFIAILRRRDYENRAELMERLETIKTENAAAGEVTFNYGMAEFRPEEDRRLSVVFERASQEMVSRK